MPRTYIEWVRLLNACTNHSYDARSPEGYRYWQRHNRKLRKLLIENGWPF